MAITERLQAARQTTNLRAKSYAVTDIDVVGASGMAAIKTTVGSLASRPDLTHNDMALLARKIGTKMLRRSKSSRWHYAHNDLSLIAAHALVYWHDPRCRDCGGHGLRVEQQLTVGPCEACNGSGKRALPTDVKTIKRRPPDCLEAALRFALSLIDNEIGLHLMNTRQRLG
ncbi:MAG TPA: hypothetical protein VIC30_07005 [Orrella sp.]